MCEHTKHHHDCGCERHHDCGCERHHDCGCEQEAESQHHAGHGCCHEGHEEAGHWSRRYQTRAEQISDLETYLGELKLEVQAVEERVADLRK